MAEIVVSSAVTVLFEKLLSGDLMKLIRSEKIESRLEKLKTKWTYIEAVLADASEKHITQESVKVWLLDLHRLAYDIEDVLDDMATESLRRKLNDELRGSTSTGKVLKKIIPNFCTNLSPHRMMYGRKMRSMLAEITEKLNGLYENKNMLGVDINTILALRSNRNFERLEETSLLDESPVLGREKDEVAVLEKLLGDESCNQNVSVVCIVGFGGVGKTTLARLLYNNEKVKNYFELRAWVCVSNYFDVLAVSKAIYQAVSGEDNTPPSKNHLQEVIKEKLSNKRFLLVLDDVWNEDHHKWKDLEKPIKGGPGSKIIVTTRKMKVASAMDNVKCHNLEILSDEDSLSLLAKSAINEHNFDNHPLSSLAQDITMKCKGLPLALIAIGRVLKGKGNDEWDKLLKSEIWSSDDGEGDILPVLKLSYYDLPLHLKKLFAYCSLFPKDYLFNKNKIVLLWMAEGFISESKRTKTMESLGRKYFEDLLSRSFIQHSTKNESEYIMHDLMHDLAISVSGEFFFMLDDKMNVNGRNEDFDKIRHFSFLDQPYDEFINFKELHKSSHLRTFLPVPVTWWSRFNTSDHVLVKLLPRLQLIRVLSFNECSIEKVPQSIGSLKHLRYLNFSHTKIKEVPKQVGELYNLQSLLVCRCSELFSLPVSFAKLINLRHLDMSDTPMLDKTPVGIGGLTSLQTLTKVFIEGANAFKVSDLKGLVNLEGHISIVGLEKVTDTQQAMEANLEGKKGLVSLEMKWGEQLDDSRNLQRKCEVIESMRPHSKLNKLKILNYGGMKFPSWFANPSFDKLTELTIEWCINCTHFNGNAFPLLKYLKFFKSGLESFNCPNSVERLEIWKCNSMTSLNLSLPSSLKVLKIMLCYNLELIHDELPSSLEVLDIWQCMNLKSFPHEYLQSLTYLKEMRISFCPSMDDSFPCGLWPPNLKFLRIGELNKPMSEWGLQNYPTSLVKLWLNGKDSGVTSFAMEGDAMNTASTSFLLPPSLTYLRISDFKDVESISEELLQHLTHLQLLDISKCPNIRDLPRSTSTLSVYDRPPVAI